ncbi:MAG: Hpt domain-containing protein, partial [Leptospirillum sp.]
MAEGFDNDEMKEIVQEFLAEAQEMLEGLDNYFVQLEARPDDTSLLNEIFRAAHSIKGSAGFIGLTRIVEVAHHAENVLNQLRQGMMKAEPAVIDIILEAMDALKLLLEEVHTGTQADVDIDTLTMKLDLLLQWGEDQAASHESTGPKAPDTEEAGMVVPPEEPEPKEPEPGEPVSSPPSAEIVSGGQSAHPPSPPPPPPSAPPQSEAAQVQSSGVEVDQTIRVETSRLDNVMNLVGE